MTDFEIKLSIVVPVYNGSDTIEELVRQVSASLENTTYADGFEMIFVNDRSPRKDAWPVIRDLSSHYPFVFGINLRRNFGQHNATMAGLSYARGRVIVIMDEDLQHPPSSIAPLADTIEEGVDVCYTRYNNRKHAAWKQWGSSFNDLVARWLLKKPKGLYLSSFKAMHQDVVKEICAYDGPYPYIDGLLLSATNSFKAIDIEHQDRLVGESGYNLRRLLSLWLKMATGSSVYPLRVATFSGFVLALMSILVLIIVIVRRVFHPDIEPGWTSIFALMLLIGGVQMVFLGIIGEYVGRIYMRLNRSPQYVVRETTFPSNPGLAVRQQEE